MSLKDSPPLKVAVYRGQNIESRHAISAVVVNSDGHIEAGWGDYKSKIYPRSSIKSIQALAVVTSGAADIFNVSDIELALASASHGAEPQHVSAVELWLNRLGLSANDLECGAHLPSNHEAMLNLLDSHHPFSAFHNNCSGKHTGMLAATLAMGEKTLGYTHKNHPVQKYIKKIIEEFCSEFVDSDSIAIDGCSIPTFFMPMKSLALAMARLGSPDNFSEKYRSASERIFKANVENPFFVAGTGRYCTEIMLELRGNGLVKTGAEGVMFAALPRIKSGVVIKVQDGATRAAELAMSWILRELGQLSEDSYKKFSEIELKNWNKISTGSIKMTE